MRYCCQIVAIVVHLHCSAAEVEESVIFRDNTGISLWLFELDCIIIFDIDPVMHDYDIHFESCFLFCFDVGDVIR